MVEMEDKMRWFVSYKDGPSLEVSAGKASGFIDLLSYLDKCVTAGDGGVYYVGDLFDKGNGKGNGKQ